MKTTKIQIIIALLLIIFSPDSNAIEQGINKDMVIQETGLPHQIEVGMSLSDLDTNRIQYRDEGKMPTSENEFYIVEKLCAEFELENGHILRIWFHSTKYGNTNIKLRLKNEKVRLSEITVDKIVESYGNVKVFEEKHPDNIETIAYWDKFDPFNLKYSTIAYPNMPYLFMFNEEKKLTSVTVSLKAERRFSHNQPVHRIAIPLRYMATGDRQRYRAEQSFYENPNEGNNNPGGRSFIAVPFTDSRQKDNWKRMKT